MTVFRAMAADIAWVFRSIGKDIRSVARDIRSDFNQLIGRSR